RARLGGGDEGAAEVTLVAVVVGGVGTCLVVVAVEAEEAEEGVVGVGVGKSNQLVNMHHYLLLLFLVALGFTPATRSTSGRCRTVLVSSPPPSRRRFSCCPTSASPWPPLCRDAPGRGQRMSSTATCEGNVEDLAERRETRFNSLSWFVLNPSAANEPSIDTLT
ncbi:hypothetical protein THAOC_29279, partial [Thalassiosira oceanica]